jgi:hypothetical protein
MTALIALLAVAAFVWLVFARTIRIVPQGRTRVIERVGQSRPSSARFMPATSILNELKLR